MVYLFVHQAMMAIILVKREQTWFPFLFGIVIKKIDRVYLGLDLTAFVYKGSIFFPL